MAIVEMEFDPSRRDFFLTGFARGRRSGGSQPPRRPGARTQPNQPQPDGGFKVTRREALGLGILATTLAGGGYIAHKLGWVFPTGPDQTPQEPETLESLVIKAKSMEDEYSINDLSDKETRDNYTRLLADIFIGYYPLGISKQQLLSSVVFVNSKEAFEELFVSRNQDPQFTLEYIKQVAARTPAFTGSDDSKIFINTSYGIFHKEMTNQDPKYPKDWNPLKSLRLVLFHEFSHAISVPSLDSVIFSIVDKNNSIKDKKITGFRIKGYTDKNEFAALYSSIDEAAVELLSKYTNTDLFNSFISKYGDTEGHSVTDIMTRLEQLMNAARIDKMELARFHKSSNLRGFLLLLAERGGIDPQRISEPDRIAFGFSLFQALIQNNQAILQDYMNSARRLAR